MDWLNHQLQTLKKTLNFQQLESHLDAVGHLKVKALVPSNTTQLQLKSSHKSLAHVRDHGNVGDTYKVGFQKETHGLEDWNVGRIPPFQK